MAITFSNSYASATYTSVNVILTQSFTVPAGTKELLIFVYVDNSNISVPLPDLVRYGGVNATLVSAIPSDAGGTGQLHFFYRILNPTAGTANLEVRHPTIQFGAAATCVVVDQNYILTYSAYSYANTASPSVSIASEAGNRTLYSFVANNVAGTSLSETGGQTVLAEGGTISNATHQLSEKVSTGATNSATWTISGGAQRTSAIAINVKEISQTLTIGSDLVPSASRTDTCTGFSNGAATISFSGVSVGVTIASGSFTWTVPMLADGVTWPRLPATSQTITLTQSALSATASANINLPTGYQTLRIGDVVGGAVANFGTLITDNERMLPYHFIAASNPLSSSKTAYFVTSNSYWVYRNGDIGASVYVNGTENNPTPVPALPRTDTLYIQESNGTIGAHSVTLSKAGPVIIATIDSVGTLRIGSSAAITVSNFTTPVNAGTLDGRALTGVSNTSITIPGLANGVASPRPGTRTLALTNGTQADTENVPVLAPMGWSSYTITAQFVQAVNGVALSYLPNGWAANDFILSPNSPTVGKSTSVSDTGIVTNYVGTQQLFLMHRTTGVVTAFNVTTTEGAAQVGSSNNGTNGIKRSIIHAIK